MPDVQESGVDPDINHPIAFSWELGWDRMPADHPVINRLLAAMLNGDVDEMDSLKHRGATLGACDEWTFKRVLWHIVDKTDVVHWLLNNGFATNREFKGAALCCSSAVDPNGCLSYPIERAYEVGNYEAVELFALYGFDDGARSLGDTAVEKDDVRLMKILRQHGFQAIKYWDASDFTFAYERKYPRNSVVRYLKETPIEPRLSLGLDAMKFRPIPQPEHLEMRLFHRRATRAINTWVDADYQDRVRAQPVYARRFAAAGRIKTLEEEAAYQREQAELSRLTCQVVLGLGR